jgi:tRNA (guanine37-N1)-methyltransferase
VIRVDVFTIFPTLVTNYASDAMLKKATERGALDLRTHDIRDHASGVHRSVDDTPYGGGAGMVLMAEPVLRALRAVVDRPRPVIVLSPSGAPFTQAVAHELAALEGFSLLCGRYEGIDQRALDLEVDRELSLGDFVIAGGELAALAVLEAVVRLVPGALGNETSTLDESFIDGLLEYPQYTKPQVVEGLEVPAVLLSGNHQEIARWRANEARRRTAQRRPDLLDER